MDLKTFKEDGHTDGLTRVKKLNTVELQWFEQAWDPENMFETGVVRANEC